MTRLIEFRRQQRIRKRLKQLDSNVQQLENTLKTHGHDNFITKQELTAAKAKIPKPYVHPRKGVCPQKPQVHKHLAKQIVGLKIPGAYDFEQLKKDHPKLKEPYLHPPKKHLHVAKDITDKIKPEQIHRKGLDADTVDGKHAKELLKRVVYMGGGGAGGEAGPHATSHETEGVDKVHFADLEHDEGDSTLHDAYTSTPHISQVEKDKIHDRQHALDSGQDHTGVITDAQHGDKTTIPDAHHPELHAASHRKGGDDIIGRVIALKFGAEGSTTTSTSYVTIADSDIALNPALFNLTGTLYVKFIYHIKNDTSGKSTNIRVYRQNAGTPVAGSEKTASGPSWSIVETAWIDFSAENVAESYQIQLKVTGGIGEFNSAIMVLSPVQL